MICLQNNGLIDLSCITIMGVNVKTNDDPIGFFGTGLKYAIAVLAREHIGFKLFIGKQMYSFSSKEKLIRGKTFNVCTMEEDQGECIELPFTTELGKHWELWQAVRELYTNCVYDEAGFLDDKNLILPNEYCTTFYINADIPFKDIFLREFKPELLLDTELLEIYSGVSQYVYCKGIQVYTLPRPALFTYNIKCNARLTEDRTLSDASNFDSYLGKTITSMDDKAILSAILECSEDYYEGVVDYYYNVHEAPGEHFVAAATGYTPSRSFNNPSIGRYLSHYAPVKEDPIEVRFKRDLEELCGIYGADLDTSELGVNANLDIYRIELPYE